MPAMGALPGERFRSGILEVYIYMADLPPPDVQGTLRDTDNAREVDVVISRDGKARSYVGQGGNEGERAADVVKKVLNDNRNAEYMPSGKKVGP